MVGNIVIRRWIPISSALIAVVALVWTVQADQFEWSRISDRDLARCIVGDPVEEPVGVKKCCELGKKTPCGYKCVNNPNCPKGENTTDKCEDAECKDGKENDLCTGTAMRVFNNLNLCQTNGKKVKCNDPPNTEKCDVTLTVYPVAAEACKIGESLCQSQPNPKCE